MWRIVGGPFDHPTGGDYSNWGWRLENDEGQVRTVRVHVSGTAQAVSDLPERTREALETKGEKAV